MHLDGALNHWCQALLLTDQAARGFREPPELCCEHFDRLEMVHRKL
jgi:hypothetical protein